MASRRRRNVDVELGRFTQRAVRRLQLRCYQLLTSASPVDTGFFRAGWTPSTGAPDRSTPTEPSGNREAIEAQAAALFSAHSNASRVLGSTYVLDLGVVFIVNNVRYGVFLNRGSSAQAPAMFVEMAVAQAVAITRAELRP